MDGIDRRDFTKAVGLFAGYVALGSTGLLGKDSKLIVTPEEFAEEASALNGNVAAAVANGQVKSVAVLDMKGKIVGVTPFNTQPIIDVGDTLEITVSSHATCYKCGFVHEGVILSESFFCT